MKWVFEDFPSHFIMIVMILNHSSGWVFEILCHCDDSNLYLLHDNCHHGLYGMNEMRTPVIYYVSTVITKAPNRNQSNGKLVG